MDRDHTQLWYIVRSTKFSFAWYVFGGELLHQGQGLHLVTRENCVGLRRSMRKYGPAGAWARLQQAQGDCIGRGAIGPLETSIHRL